MTIRFYTLYVAALIVAVFVVIQQILGISLAWPVGSVSITFFTSMIAHSGMPHLIGNLFSLLLFGLILEGTVGSRRFLQILFFAAVAGNIAAIGSYTAVLGLSGGIYGLIGALSVLRPKMVIWVSGLPVPMVLAGIGYAAVDLLGAIDPVSNTGHLAHLAGIVVGAVIGWYLRSPEDNNKKPSASLSSNQKKAIDQQLDVYENRYLR